MRAFVFFIVVFLVGCTKQPQVKEIENLKKKRLEKELVFLKKPTKYKAEIKDIETIEKISIDSDFNIRFRYLFSKEKVYFNKRGYFIDIPLRGSYYCGYGCFAGWLCIFTGFKDYSKINSKICNSHFSSVDGYAIGEKTFFGLLTFMTPFVTAAGVYTKRFDKEKFEDFVLNSKIYLFKNKLINQVKSLNLENGVFDVVYVDDDFEDTLNDKYKKLLFYKGNILGDVFVSRNNDSYSVIVFKNYENEFLSIISSQINDILKDFSKVDLKYVDITALIPPKIKKPKLPPFKKLQKSEFETKEEFKKRVLEALKKRDEEIRKIKEKYYLDVYKRNMYIEMLKKSYEEYLNNQQEISKENIKTIKNNLELLSKYLTLEQFVFEAEDFRYDAEERKLYFVLLFNGEKKAYIKVMPQIAKSIKLKQMYKIVPDFDFNNKTIVLKGFKLFAFKDEKFYPIYFTNKLFKPSDSSAKIVTSNEVIKNLVQKEFDKYKQKPLEFKKENILLIQNINYNSIHRVPKWFINPPKDKLIGYGSGKTYQEAISNARAELAKMLEIKVEVSYYSEKRFKNFKSFKDVSKKSKQVSNVKLTKDDYKIYKQTKKDGIWYVGLEYTRKDK